VQANPGFLRNWRIAKRASCRNPVIFLFLSFVAEGNHGIYIGRTIRGASLSWLSYRGDQNEHIDRPQKLNSSQLSND
jgi:hypothetical protein